MIALPYMGIAWPEAPANTVHLMVGAILVGGGVLANFILFTVGDFYYGHYRLALLLMMNARLRLY